MMACAHHSNACDFKNLEKKKQRMNPFIQLKLGICTNEINNQFSCTVCNVCAVDDHLRARLFMDWHRRSVVSIIILHIHDNPISNSVDSHCLSVVMFDNN